MKATSTLLKRIIPVEKRSIPARDVVRYVVPLPPPLNSMYRNDPDKGRVKSDRYKAWVKEAGWALQTQRPGPIRWPVDIEIVLPTKTRGDRDAYQKQLIDLAVRHGIIPNDTSEIVHDIHILRRDLLAYDAADSATVTITRVPGRVG